MKPLKEIIKKDYADLTPQEYAKVIIAITDSLKKSDGSGEMDADKVNEFIMALFNKK